MLLVTPLVAVRRWLVRAAAVILITASLSLLALHFNRDALYWNFSWSPETVNRIFLFLEIALTLYVVYIGARFKRWLVCLMALIQTVLMAFFEWQEGSRVLVENNLFVDRFSVIMALIAGVIGGLIVLYANGYMLEFHKHYHKELKDRRLMFFPSVFVFLSAMFGLS